VVVVPVSKIVLVVVSISGGKVVVALAWVTVVVRTEDIFVVVAATDGATDGIIVVVRTGVNFVVTDGVDVTIVAVVVSIEVTISMLTQAGSDTFL